jgi:hypothetical protein
MSEPGKGCTGYATRKDGNKAFHEVRVGYTPDAPGMRTQ